MAKKNKFEGISDEELRQELIGREADRRVALNEAHRDCCALVLENIDLLIRLVPEHDTLNCSDTNLASAYTDHGKPRCRRCRLLTIRNQGYNHDTMMEMSFLTIEELDNTPDNIRIRIE